MDPSDLQQPSETQLLNILNEELDIPDAVFVNQDNVAPPEPKTRANVIRFEQEISEKASIANDEVYRARRRVEGAETTEYKVQKALAERSNQNSLIALLRVISNDIGSIKRDVNTMQTKITTMETKITTMETKITTMQTDIKSIKDDVAEMKPLMHLVRTSENSRRREMRQPQIPVPFLVGDGPEGTDLPQIESVEDIESLNVEQLRRFLTGYGVTYPARSSKKHLKILLRDSLGFFRLNDISKNFT